jgi:hypothetical protein
LVGYFFMFTFVPSNQLNQITMEIYHILGALFLFACVLFAYKSTKAISNIDVIPSMDCTETKAIFDEAKEKYSETLKKLDDKKSDEHYKMFKNDDIPYPNF